ncbi:MAG: gamma-glutamyltransferase [Xanthobacteraceae bacterium]
MTRFARLASTTLVLVAAMAIAGAGLTRDRKPPASEDTARIAMPRTEVVRIEPVVARRGMVVSQEQQASRIGADILARGGNAVDAAVAVGFALAVTLPKAGNLGGGGFMLVHLAKSKETVAIDYRETAPAAATADMFLDADGNADPEKSRFSGLGVGVPGTVGGLILALENYGSGRFTLAELIAPAVKLAREGIPVEGDLLDSLLLAAPRLQRWPSSAAIFAKADGTPWTEGDRLQQPQLANTLETIGREGPRAFYHGPIADKIVSAVREAGGRMTRGDLETYWPVVREPVRGTYRGFDIVSMSPPSSGGVHLIEMLNILEGFPLKTLGGGRAETLHLMIEAMKLAYADRAELMGDRDRVEVPVERLISKEYAAELRAGIDLEQARPADSIRPDSSALGGGNTTHYSIIDESGNAVANTTSLNFSYGVGLVAGDTGILLNNTLDDFAAKPGAPNAFGLIGASANAPGPGKRPLSSMTPTIVLKDGAPVVVTGAPGGGRIITTVLQVIVNSIDFDRPIAQAVAAPRVHHQWRPDAVLVEPALPAATRRALEKLGHKLELGPLFGSAHSIAVTPEGFVGAADTRAAGSLAAGP